MDQRLNEELFWRSCAKVANKIPGSERGSDGRQLEADRRHIVGTLTRAREATGPVGLNW